MTGPRGDRGHALEPEHASRLDDDALDAEPELSPLVAPPARDVPSACATQPCCG
ncbi:MAG: hypothetical protein M5U28_11995 [Sandaracinaceae bacterium]|nr:hypothetical protein [Sandaracinaceae bacterium]